MGDHLAVLVDADAEQQPAFGIVRARRRCATTVQDVARGTGRRVEERTEAVSCVGGRRSSDPRLREEGVADLEDAPLLGAQVGCSRAERIAVVERSGGIAAGVLGQQVSWRRGAPGGDGSRRDQRDCEDATDAPPLGDRHADGFCPGSDGF